MSDEFIDSNIFVYLFDETDQRKNGIARQLVYRALEAGTGCISFQVVQETLNVITRKLPSPANPEDARLFMQAVLAPLWHVMPSVELYQRGLNIQARYHYSFYDSLILSAALDAGCKTLHSEDMQHGQTIDRLRVNNPFSMGQVD